MFLSVNDRVIYISTGKGMKDILTDSAITAIIESMKPYLKQYNYD